MILNFIGGWDFDSEALGSVEYSFIVFIPEYTQIWRRNTSWGSYLASKKISEKNIRLEYIGSLAYG